MTALTRSVSTAKDNEGRTLMRIMRIAFTARCYGLGLLLALLAGSAMAIPAYAAVDLRVEALALTPTTTTAGSEVTATYRVANRGTTTLVATSRKPYTDRLYLSTDATLDASDTLLGTSHGHTVDLSPQETHYHAQSVTIPVDITPGNYVVLVHTDALAVVAESDEANNVASALLLVAEPPASTYTNPIIDAYLADPYILRVKDTYYLYATESGQTHDGRRIPIWRSTNLRDWEFVRGAVTPGPGAWNWRNFWAPEVLYANKVYYLYYTAKPARGGDNHIGVATSQSPEGPFVDYGPIVSGRAIDGHPFRDDDGQLYLYIVRGGGNIYVTRMTSPTQPDENGYVYLGCCSEGPNILKRDGVYYLITSVGDWRSNSYRADWSSGESPLGPFTKRGTLLKSSGDAKGPGHNSVFVTPDGQDWLVYHAWDVKHTARYPHIDRLTVGPEGLTTNGPTTTPQPEAIPEP